MTMNNSLVNKHLGPCGLHCGKCFAFAEGEIHQLSQQLEKALGNFDVYAQRFTEMLEEPLFSKYADFKAFLHYLATASCQGCRQQKCQLFSECQVRSCSQQKGVAFCFECPDFPCNNTGFDEHLHQRYLAINRRMQEIGPEAYYDEVKDQSRYK